MPLLIVLGLQGVCSTPESLELWVVRVWLPGPRETGAQSMPSTVS